MSPWSPPPPGTPRPAPGTVADVVALLRDRRTAVLTGAGISTDSGLPDYRGPGSPPRHPITYQQFLRDPRFRRHYWARNYVGWRHAVTRRPNDAHRALADLERAGLVTGVVTQNVDLLHEMAGSRHVVDLHGRWDTVVCLHCGARLARSDLDRRLEALNPGFERRIGVPEDVEIAPDADAVIERTGSFRMRACWRPAPATGPATEPDNGFARSGECGGRLKPDIVFFGENVPPDRAAAAAALVDDAQALLVVGTSLAVYSGLRLARRAATAGEPVAIVNRGGTRGDDLATVTVDAGAAETLRAVADALTSPRAA